MKRSLIFSVLASVASLVLVGISPIDVPIREQERIYSPYHEEIEELLRNGETAMTPSESAHLKDLVEKNNKWFEENLVEHSQATATTALNAWRKKSEYMSPIVMLIWGVSFFFFQRREPKNVGLVVLVVPIILTLVGLIPLVEVALIGLAVVVVWFWFVMNPGKGKKGTEGLKNEQ